MRPATTTRVTDTVEIGDAWAGHAVGFDLLTRADRQIVAYYGPNRQLTVAQRTLGEDDWTHTTLPERVPWDSHNDLALAADSAGHLHLSGNMHGDPLVYFQSRRPLDATTFERVDTLVGRDEGQVTYPRFLDGPDGLVFMYRDGASGAGRRLLNAYDPESGWRRLLDAPLLDGGDAANAYPAGPIQGPNGDYHLFWVWRDSPDAATNHDLSYAWSPDLRSWRRADGQALGLPITPEDDCLVDPVQSGGGLLNSNVAPGFDADGRPTVTYHKHVDDGTEAVVARLESGRWRVRVVSDWGERWDFGGPGSLDDRIVVDPICPTADGLVATFWHAAYGPGRWHLDAETLAPTGTDVPWHGLPEAWRDPAEEGFAAQWAVDGEWALRWDALPPNRDRARDSAPPPSRLRVCRLDPEPSRQT